MVLNVSSILYPHQLFNSPRQSLLYLLRCYSLNAVVVVTVVFVVVIAVVVVVAVIAAAVVVVVDDFVWQFCKNQDGSWSNCQSSIVGYSAAVLLLLGLCQPLGSII